MYMQSKEESARRERNGLDSHILLQRECLPDVSLPATWVDVILGSRWWLQDHPFEQVYVITAGGGSILAGEEERRVGPGDLVYFTSGTIHGIENSQKRCSPTSLGGDSAWMRKPLTTIVGSYGLRNEPGWSGG
jgi:mannose-6-phosphate isomerase-like protein (cupin superfamily)